MNPVMIDVREKDEFDCEHIENSIHLPLSSFAKLAPAILHNLDGKNVQLMCRSGKRSNLALQQAQAFKPSGTKLEVYPGGILEWKAQGGKVIGLTKSVLPIMRQVQIVAGSLMVTGVLLSIWVNPALIWLSGFVGAGLTFAGVTGFCGMAELLTLMPWNKNANPSLCEPCAK